MNLAALLVVAGIAAAAFGLVIAGMAVGVVFSGRRIQGSCGGLGTMQGADGRSPCMACGDEAAACDTARKAACAEEAATEAAEFR